jgi:hypothetical protein
MDFKENKVRRKKKQNKCCGWLIYELHSTVKPNGNTSHKEPTDEFHLQSSENLLSYHGYQ